MINIQNLKIWKSPAEFWGLYQENLKSRRYDEDDEKNDDRFGGRVLCKHIDDVHGVVCQEAGQS